MPAPSITTPHQEQIYRILSNVYPYSFINLLNTVNRIPPLL
jgi:hypothetical protein